MDKKYWVGIRVFEKHSDEWYWKVYCVNNKKEYREALARTDIVEVRGLGKLKDKQEAEDLLSNYYSIVERKYGGSIIIQKSFLTYQEADYWLSTHGMGINPDFDAHIFDLNKLSYLKSTGCNISFNSKATKFTIPPMLKQPLSDKLHSYFYNLADVTVDATIAIFKIIPAIFGDISKKK